MALAIVYMPDNSKNDEYCIRFPKTLSGEPMVERKLSAYRFPIPNTEYPLVFREFADFFDVTPEDFLTKLKNGEKFQYIESEMLDFHRNRFPLRER